MFQRPCQYRFALGIPDQGVHSTRFLGLAFVDLFLTVVGSYLISMYTKKDFYNVFTVVFLLGIFLHWLFCVPTALNRMLGI
jgi:hypothetical protein